MDEESKKCPFCAELVKVDAVLCKHCKSPFVSAESGPAFVIKSVPVQVEVVKDEKSKKGLGLSSIIVGGFGVLGGFGTVTSAMNYPIPTVTSSELGLLAIISLVSLGLAIGAKVKKQKLGTAALIVSIASTVFWQLSSVWAIPSPLG
jgi:hypothetical protein